MNLDFSDIEKDILREIVNLGVAKSADAFASLAKEKVLLHTPEINLLKTDELGSFSGDMQTKSLIVDSDINGDISGKAYLLFSEEQAQEMANICLAHLKKEDSEYEKLKESLIVECGNIITACLVTQICNALQLNALASTPTLTNSYAGTELQSLARKYPLFKPMVFTIKTKFLYSFRNIDFPLILVLDMNALHSVLVAIRKFDYENFQLMKLNSQV